DGLDVLGQVLRFRHLSARHEYGQHKDGSSQCGTQLSPHVVACFPDTSFAGRLNRREPFTTDEYECCVAPADRGYNPFLEILPATDRAYVKEYVGLRQHAPQTIIDTSGSICSVLASVADENLF